MHMCSLNTLRTFKLDTPPRPPPPPPTPWAMKAALEHQGSEARQDTFKGWILTWVEMIMQPVGVSIHVLWDRTDCSEQATRETS